MITAGDFWRWLLDRRRICVELVVGDRKQHYTGVRCGVYVRKLTPRAVVVECGPEHLISASPLRAAGHLEIQFEKNVISLDTPVLVFTNAYMHVSELNKNAVCYGRTWEYFLD